jgi:hypothetical protein
MSEIISPRQAKTAHWRRVLAEQSASGQSIRVFCAERQINQHTFQYWREKFLHSNQNLSSRFIAVSRCDVRTTSPRISLPNGVTIDLGDGLDSNSVNKFLLHLCGVGLSGGTDAKY